MAADMCLTQLPDILEGTAEFQHSPFFSDQLTAFEVWLDLGSYEETQQPPEQLPVVLQVLLSQQHRLRALELLERFLELGPWAVRKALSVGIFPYVFKLLGSPAKELRAVLVSLWTKILAVDSDCKADLIKSAASPVRKSGAPPANSKAFNYFLATMSNTGLTAELQTNAAFVIAVFIDDNPKGRRACVDAGLIELALSQLKSSHSKLRLWLCLVLGKAWSSNTAGRLAAIQLSAIPKVAELLCDSVPAVRAAAAFALGRLIGPWDSADASVQQEIVPPSSDEDEKRLNLTDIGSRLISCRDDGSHTVRAELVVGLSTLLHLYRDDFHDAIGAGAATPHATGSLSDSAWRILQTLGSLATDPTTEVSELAKMVLQGAGLCPVTDHPDPTRAIPVSQNIAASSTISWVGSLGVGSLGVGSYIGSFSVGRLQSFDLPQSLSGSKENLTRETADSRTDSAPSSVTELTSSDVELHLTTYLDAINEVATLMTDRGEPSAQDVGESSISDTDDLQAKLANHVQAMVTLFPRLEPKFITFGWQKNRFDHTVTAEEVQKMASAIAFSVGRTPGLDPKRISTRFFEWCCKTFCNWTASTESHSNAVIALEQQEWRRERNESVKKSGAEMIREAEALRGKLKLSETIFHTPTKETCELIVFHPYEPFLIMANKKSGNIFVWDTERMVEISAFHNGNEASYALSSLQLLNDHDVALLAVGSSDGFVRIWADFCTAAPRTITGWRPVTKLKKANGLAAGLIIGWSQSRGHLFAGGDVQYLQIWDASTESRIQKISTGVSSPLTSICVNPDDSGLLVAGFGNGNVCLLDPRISAKQAVVQVCTTN